MNKATQHIQACMEAWLNCENLLINIAQKNTSISTRTKGVIDECAQICLGTLHALKNSFLNVQELALLCVGICEECAEVCDRYNDGLFKNCASACRHCSSSITTLATPAV